LKLQIEKEKETLNLIYLTMKPDQHHIHKALHPATRSANACSKSTQDQALNHHNPKQQ
jgi:hypothetical protein